jgi:hypothetical protein
MPGAFLVWKIMLGIPLAWKNIQKRDSKRKEKWELFLGAGNQETRKGKRSKRTLFLS